MHGADGIGTELMAQRLDVAVDGAGAGCVDPVPDLFEQLFADLLLLIDERTLLQKLDGDQ